MIIEDSLILGKYPQIETGIPPKLPPKIAGFHSTSLDVEIRKPLIYQGLISLSWMSLDCLKRVTGGERGIRTPGRAFDPTTV
jgi:hypothetical protein